MSEFKIEKGIPIPEDSHRRYPFNKMEIGDSCFIPDKRPEQISGSLTMMRPKKFTRRYVTENGIVGTRIWRTA